jgi:hypothetical protein
MVECELNQPVQNVRLFGLGFFGNVTASGL